MNYAIDADKDEKQLFCHSPTFSPITLQWQIQTFYLYAKGKNSINYATDADKHEKE